MTSRLSIILTLRENSDPLWVISEIERALHQIAVNGSIVVVGAPELALGDNVVIAKETVRDALVEAPSEWVITLTSEEPDPYERIVALWAERELADVVIASQSSADRSTRPKDLHSELDRLTAMLTSRFLSLDVVDMKSMTRLYQRAVIDDLLAYGCDFNDAIGIIVDATVCGWRIREIERPFWLSRGVGYSKVRPSLRTMRRYWSARNGIHDADYDMRAFNSRVPLQRKWQQRRHELTMELVRPFASQKLLNVGCGSARMNLDLPGAFGVDVVQPKLRFLNHYGVNHLTAASVGQLPFRDGEFDCVICAEVIEHVPRATQPLRELARVVAPRGRLIVSTPNYGTPLWPVIERLYGLAQPGGYADDHVTHYTQRSLVAEAASLGLECVAMRHLYGAIVIGAFERPAATD